MSGGVMDEEAVLPTAEQLAKHSYEVVVPDKKKDQKDTRSTLRRVYVLGSLAKRGLLGEPEMAAAVEFSIQFRRARLEGVRAASMEERVDGTAREPVTVSIAEARRNINDAVHYLGGGTASSASVIWHVVGLEHSLSRWITDTASPYNNKEATGVLVTSLQHLARYWGY